MPYLRMFIGERVVDEVYISEMILQTVLGNHSVAEEKQKLLNKHHMDIQNSGKQPTFTLDAVPSAINTFKPLNKKND